MDLGLYIDVFKMSNLHPDSCGFALAHTDRRAIILASAGCGIRGGNSLFTETQRFIFISVFQMWITKEFIFRIQRTGEECDQLCFSTILIGVFCLTK